MRLADLNGFDWLRISVVVFSMVMAFRRGLVRATLGLLGVVGGFLFATWYYTRLGDWINDMHWITSSPAARIVAFLVIVVVVASGFELAGRILQGTLRAVGLSTLDRTLGAAFGFVRGCLAGVALLMVATAVAPQSQTVTKSVLSPYLFAVAHDVSFLVPQYMQRLMMNGAYNLKQNSPHWINGR